mmetsp:Transcript_5573/g.13890  ORF Transcript_5573/g.13890 Transcript_5573/m.13890 type:complete len:223 (-) Transcript_5573:140-808(-)
MRRMGQGWGQDLAMRVTRVRAARRQVLTPRSRQQRHMPKVLSMRQQRRASRLACRSTKQRSLLRQWRRSAGRWCARRCAASWTRSTHAPSRTRTCPSSLQTLGCWSARSPQAGCPWPAWRARRQRRCCAARCEPRASRTTPTRCSSRSGCSSSSRWSSGRSTRLHSPWQPPTKGRWKISSDLRRSARSSTPLICRGRTCICTRAEVPGTHAGVGCVGCLGLK